MDQRAPLNAFLVALVAVGFLSAMDAVMKALVIAIGAYPTMIWRSLLASALLVLPYFLWRRRRPTPRAMRYHLIRGAIMLPMSFLFFWGLGRVPMAQAIALTFIAPLIALVLAGVLLKEPVGPRTIAGSLLAALGVAAIFFGQSQASLGREALIGSFAIIGSAICYAFNIIVMRQQAQNAGPLEIAFFQFVLAGVGFALFIPFVGLPPPPVDDGGALLAATLLSITGMLLLAYAYARAGAGYLSATEYSGFVYAAIFGWLFFAEVPSPFTLFGAALIVGGCWVAARTRTIDHPTLESAG